MSAELVDVVVGAASGMGAAAARAIASDRRLVLADIDSAGAHDVAAGLPQVSVVECDISDQEAVESLVAGVGTPGRIVITAGLSPTMASGERILEVNLVGMARLLESFQPAVGPGTAAVCFASMAGHIELGPELAPLLDDPLESDVSARLHEAGIDLTDPGAAYAFSKFGVIRLVRKLSVTWGRQGARILSLSPGIIDTQMGRQELAQQEMMQSMIDGSAIVRMGGTEEVASVVAFLTSDDASFMTGCDVLVDGGCVAGNFP